MCTFVNQDYDRDEDDRWDSDPEEDELEEGEEK
jgi:hypothetical protein